MSFKPEKKKTNRKFEVIKRLYISSIIFQLLDIVFIFCLIILK